MFESAVNWHGCGPKAYKNVVGVGVFSGETRALCYTKRASISKNRTERRQSLAIDSSH